MNDEGAPDRLLALAAPDSVLGRGLRAAQGRAPSEKEIRALETRLAATLGATALGMAVAAGTTKGAAVTTSAWLSAGAIKVTMAAVAVTTALGVGGGVAWQRHVAAAKRQAVRAVAVQGPPPRSLRVSATAAVQEPAAAPPPVVVDTPPETVVRYEQPAPVSARPAAPPSSARPATRSRLRSAMPVGEPRPTSVPSDDPALTDELSLIDRAQRALHDDPRRALELAQEHGRRFPNQFLEQEREVIEVTALMKLERQTEAVDRARRFVNRFPGSAHAVRMRAVAASLPR